MKNISRQFKHYLATHRWLWVRFVTYFYDFFVVVASWFLANLFRFNFEIFSSGFMSSLDILPLVIFLQLGALALFRLDRIIVQFISLHDVVRILQSSLSATLTIYLLTIMLEQIQDIPFTTFLLDSIFMVVFLGGGRLVYLLFREGVKPKGEGLRTLIIGAGRAGEILARELLREGQRTYFPVGFLDDDRDKQGKEILGIRVLGRCRILDMIIKRLDIEMVLIANPGLKSQTIQRITERCRDIGVQYRILPSAHELISGQAVLSSIREVTMEDILGRNPIELEWRRINETIKNKSIFVTGAGGSIGGELCRQIAKREPDKIILFEQSEYALYHIELELKNKFPEICIASYLGDVKDRDYVESILKKEKPYIIFHAAAYKHVPIVEMNPREGILTNIFGTKVMAEAASACNVPKFVFISSDKAVFPTNIMGATKRIAELLCISLNDVSENTSYIITRFGNVLESSGSVVPLFKKQVAEGGPVTVTHPEIERFFMTNSEACQLVLQAASVGKGGEIFVLDMGEPVRIIDLAEQIIKLAGYVPNKDIEIKFTGLRPGEKLYEELFYPEESPAPTPYSKLLLARGKSVDWIWLQAQLKRLKSAKEEMEIKSGIRSIVSEYHYQIDEKDKKEDISAINRVKAFEKV